MHTRKLIKKELRLQKNNLLFFGALVVFVLLVCILGRTPVADIGLSPMGHVRDLLQLVYLLAGAFGLIFLMPAMFGATVFAEEKRLGTDEWASGLPVSSRKVFFVKIGVVLVLSALSGGIIALLLDQLAPYQKIYHVVLRGHWPILLSILAASMGAYLSSFRKDSYRALIFVPILFLIYLATISMVDRNWLIFPVNIYLDRSLIFNLPTFPWLLFNIPAAILIFFAYRNYSRQDFKPVIVATQICIMAIIIIVGAFINLSKHYKVLTPATLKYYGQLDPDNAFKGVALKPRYLLIRNSFNNNYHYDKYFLPPLSLLIKKLSFAGALNLGVDMKNPYLISPLAVDEQRNILTGTISPNKIKSSGFDTKDNSVIFSFNYKTGSLNYDYLFKKKPHNYEPPVKVLSDSGTSFSESLNWKEIVYNQYGDKKLLLGYTRDVIPWGVIPVSNLENLTTGSLPAEVARYFEKDNNRFIEISALPVNSPMNDYLEKTSATLGFSIIASENTIFTSDTSSYITRDPYHNRIAYLRESIVYDEKFRLSKRLHHLFFLDLETRKESYVGSFGENPYSEAIRCTWMPSGKLVLLTPNGFIYCFENTSLSEPKRYSSNVLGPDLNRNHNHKVIVGGVNTLILLDKNDSCFVLDLTDERLKPELYELYELNDELMPVM